jgi:PAS domain S-box-containing protein
MQGMPTQRNPVLSAQTLEDAAHRAGSMQKPHLATVKHHGIAMFFIAQAPARMDWTNTWGGSYTALPSPHSGEASGSCVDQPGVRWPPPWHRDVPATTMNSPMPLDVSTLLVFGTSIQWVLAGCLWLVWRQEPTQVFARLVALAYFCSGGLVLCYALFRTDWTAARVLGIGLACIMSAGFFHGMTVGLRTMAGGAVTPVLRMVGVVAPTILASAFLVAAETRILQALVMVYTAVLGGACMVWLRQGTRIERWIGPLTILIAVNQLPWLLLGEAALQWQFHLAALLRVALASLITIAALGRASRFARESEARFRALLDAVPDIMTVARMDDGVIVQVNPAFERASGLAAHEVVGRPVTAVGVWARPHEREHLLDALRQHGSVRGFEHDAITPAGTRRVSVSAAVFMLDGKPHTLSLTQDITEQRQQEQALRHSKAMHKALFEAMPEYVSVSVLETGELLEVSRGFEELTGWTRQEALGRTSLELGILSPEVRDQLALNLRASGGQLRMQDVPMHRKNGQPIEGVASLAVYEVDGRQYLTAIGSDVTEQRQKERTLRHSNAMHQALFQAMPEYAAISELATGKLLEVSSGFEDVTGWSRDEVLGRTSTELNIITPEFREVFRAELRRCKGQVRGLEGHLVRKDGREVVAEASLAVYEVDDQQYLVSIATDVTQSRQREAALRASEARYALIFDLVPEYVVLARASDGCLVEVNRGFEQTTGWSRTEAVGRTTVELGLISSSERQRMLAAVESGHGLVRNLDLEITGRNGEPLQTLYSANLMNHAGENYLLAVVRDITQERRREAELRATQAAKQAAEVANQLKGDFLAMISHEVRTPLGGVIGMLQFALKDTQLSPPTQEKLAIGLSNAQTLLQIINDILDFSRLQAGKMPLEIIDFRLAALVRDAVTILEDRAQSKGLSLVAEVDPQLAPWWQGDPTRLRQVLINLLGNAIKFTQHGEVRLVVRECAGGGLLFEVRDTGIGMAPDVLQRLFHRFEQADSSTARRFGGTGLGLAICKSLVEAMGGTIAVTSVQGSGTVFTVSLPLTLGSPVVEVPGATTAPHARSLRVLCAEDGVTNQIILRELVTAMGHQFTLAEDGEAALAALTQADYDLLILDSRMPRLDGIEVLRILRAGQRGVRNAALPVIACTANAGADERERFLGAGANDFLPKPIDESALHIAIGQVIGQPSAPATAAMLPTGNAMAATAAMRMAFISEGPRLVSALRSALAQGDIAGCARAAHGLKGSAGYFGARQLQECARAAEQHADAGELTAVAEFVEPISNAMEALIATLRPAQATTLSAEPTLVPHASFDNHAWLDQLATLQALLERHSLDAQPLLDDLLAQLPAGPLRTAVHAMAEQVAQFDFAAARTALAALRATLESSP